MSEPSSRSKRAALGSSNVPQVLQVCKQYAGQVAAGKSVHRKVLVFPIAMTVVTGRRVCPGTGGFSLPLPHLTVERCQGPSTGQILSVQAGRGKPTVSSKTSPHAASEPSSQAFHLADGAQRCNVVSHLRNGEDTVL